jgi:glycosyltransferase involved in cell wall biosynthesis
MRPLVSVITPVLNGRRFIDDTIRSVTGQRYDNIEYIIIDGGSTDGSVDVIKKYGDRVNRWLSEKDEGMYDAVNKGLRMASGEIVAYINSDDLYHPDALQIISDYFAGHSDTALVYGDCDLIDENGRFLYTYRYPDFRMDFFLALDHCSIPQPASFWRRSIHEKIGCFDPSYKMAGDFDFFARAGRHLRIDHIRKPLAMHRMHGGSLTSSGHDCWMKEIREVQKRYKVPGGLRSAILQCRGECRIKAMNLPLLIRKLLGMTR